MEWLAEVDTKHAEEAASWRSTTAPTVVVSGQPDSHG